MQCVFLAVNLPILNPWKKQTQFCLDAVDLNKSSKLSLGLPGVQKHTDTCAHELLGEKWILKSSRGHLHQQVIQLFSAGEEDKVLWWWVTVGTTQHHVVNPADCTYVGVGRTGQSSLLFTLCLMCLMHSRSYLLNYLFKRIFLALWILMLVCLSVGPSLWSRPSYLMLWNVIQTVMVMLYPNDFPLLFL